jgi:hypothetical protein
VPYLVGIAIGSLAMRDNMVTLDTGPPRLGVVLVDREAIWPGGAAVAVSGTLLANYTGRPAVLLRDWSGGTTVLEINQIPAGNTLVSRDGLALHRAKQAAQLSISWLRGIASRLHRLAALILHPLA